MKIGQFTGIRWASLLALGSSSGILFHLKEREGPSQRQRDESSNNDSDPMPITYMQLYIIVQDSVNYSPPEIV